MEILDDIQTAERLPYPELAESIRDVAVSRREGELEAPSRTVLDLPGDGNLLVMPASDEELAITKLVTVHPDNAGRNLPTIQGEVIVMEAGTGVRLGVLDGSVVTGRRTAALSLLAAQTLAPHPEGPLLIVGAGTQGNAHLEAFREGLGISEVFVASRTEKSASSLVGRAEDLGLEAHTVDTPEEVLDEVRLIVTATTSHDPVLPDELPDGMFVAAVGAFNPQMAELSPRLISSSTVVVDTLEGTQEEAGDLIQASHAGLFEWEDATELGDLLENPEPPTGPVVFKSVGHALWDLAAARTAYTR